MPKFAVLMRENDNAWSKLAPDVQQTLGAMYQAWAEELRRKGVFHGGEALGTQARELRVVDGRVVETPYANTRDVLTGYFVIEASDMDAAAAIARDCPALTHGDSVELRAIGD